VSGVRFLLVGVCVAASTVLTACIPTAIVTTVLVVEMLTPYGYTLTLKAEDKPRKVFDELVDSIQRIEPEVRVVTYNQSERIFQAKWNNQEGVEEWVSLRVAPLPDETSQVLIAAGYGHREGPKFREWVLAKVDVWFEPTGIEWKVASTSLVGLKGDALAAAH
jgi:hypothetical protein